jgi:2-methylisocitrate lyase-like PEP mutase family enzyme
MTDPRLASLAERAERLRALHHAPEPLILANAWDVASATAIERAGSAAIATTSSGVAASLGFPDGEGMPASEMLAAVGRIVAAVSVPVTADMEAGYGLPARTLLDGLLGAGAVGLNLEDTDRAVEPPGLANVDRQAERLAAIRRAATDAGVPIVINARIDVFLRSSAPAEDQIADTIHRARAYAKAGADCVFPIWLADSDAIGRVVRGVDAPVNILLRPGTPPIDALVRLGVRRISVGGGLAHHALDATEALARRLLAGDGTPFAELGES